MKKIIGLAVLAFILTIGLAFVIEQTATMKEESTIAMQIDFDDVGLDLKNPISKIRLT